MVLIALVGAGCGSRGRGDHLAVRQVAARVERIRGLRFVRLPPVHLVSDARDRAITARLLPVKALGPAASDFTGSVPGAMVPVVERLELFELVGAVPVGTTLAQLLLGGREDPGGFFDPRSRAVYVRRAQAAGLGGEEGVLAHELTHAIEFQHQLHPITRVRGFDQYQAATALIEGPAVLVQYLYATRYLGFRGPLSRYLAIFTQRGQRLLHLPRVLLAEVIFPYVAGTRYVERQLKLGGWNAVTKVERDPPPNTQTMLTGHAHPAEHDPTFNVARVLGRHWQPEPRQTLGDYDTALLLAPNPLAPSSSLIDRWRGGSLQLWNDLQASRVTKCRRPCAAHFALLAAWRWSDAATAKTAAGDLRRLLAPILTDQTRRRTQLGSSVAIMAGGKTTTLALAPSAPLANALAAAANRAAAS